MWQRFPCPLEGWDHDHEDDSCLVCTLRAELAALREMVEDMNQTGAGLLTLLENPKTFETLVPADWLSRVRWGHPTVVAAYARLRDLATARALLARVSDSSYENISLNRAWVIDEEVVEDVRAALAAHEERVRGGGDGR